MSSTNEQWICGPRWSDGQWSRSALVIIWLAFFSYTNIVALLFQYLVLPMLPSLYAGQGLMFGDSISFHQAAQALAEKIASNGWSAWAPWPSVNTHGNVAVLAALYALFGPNPSVAIPINACLHASSGVLLILIGKELPSASAARFGTVLAACLFIGFPSALNWYGQIHKDGYAILGFLLLLYSGVKILRLEYLREALNPLFSAGAGLALTAFVRPSNLQLYELMALGMLVIAIATYRRMNARCLIQIVFSVMIVSAAISIRAGAHQMQTTVGTIVTKEQALASTRPARASELMNWRWVSSPSFPAFVDDLARKLSHLRVFMAAYGVRENAGSMIDLDSRPSNIEEFFSYLPRAILIGVFAPFPETWVGKLNLSQTIGVAETFLWYMIFPGLLWSAWRRRRDPVLWWLVVCALGLLMVESYITSNLGTLHRVRYPFLFVFIYNESK